MQGNIEWGSFIWPMTVSMDTQHKLEGNITICCDVRDVKSISGIVRGVKTSLIMCKKLVEFFELRELLFYLLVECLCPLVKLRPEFVTKALKLLKICLYLPDKCLAVFFACRLLVSLFESIVFGTFFSFWVAAFGYKLELGVRGRTSCFVGCSK